MESSLVAIRMRPPGPAGDIFSDFNPNSSIRIQPMLAGNEGGNPESPLRSARFDED